MVVSERCVGGGWKPSHLLSAHSWTATPKTCTLLSITKPGYHLRTFHPKTCTFLCLSGFPEKCDLPKISHIQYCTKYSLRHLSFVSELYS